MIVAVRPDRFEGYQGVAAAALFVDGQRARRFSPTEAQEYAAVLTTFAQRAETVLAIRQQMMDPESGIGLRAASDVVGEFLADLPPPPVGIWPVSLALARDERRLGLVGVRVLQSSWTWTPRECRAHALDVLRVSAEIDLARTYRRVLTNYLGLTEERADLIVADVENYRRG